MMYYIFAFCLLYLVKFDKIAAECKQVLNMYHTIHCKQINKRSNLFPGIPQGKPLTAGKTENSDRKNKA